MKKTTSWSGWRGEGAGGGFTMDVKNVVQGAPPAGTFDTLAES